jgi:ribosomal protein L20
MIEHTTISPDRKTLSTAVVSEAADFTSIVKMAV